MEKHLVLFQVVSAGQNGAELGTDEEQIVYVLYTILNVEENKVRFIACLETWHFVQLGIFWEVKYSDVTSKIIFVNVGKVIVKVP